MLDMKLLREKPDFVKAMLKRRGEDVSVVDQLISKDTQRRTLIQAIEDLKAKRNTISKQIGQYKREGKDVSEILAAIDDQKASIGEHDIKLKALESDIRHQLLMIPNLPHKDIPEGHDESDNVEVKKHGSFKTFDFEPKPHWDIATALIFLILNVRLKSQPVVLWFIKD